MSIARPVVAVTGADGDIGASLVRALQEDYTVVGLDRGGETDAERRISIDLTDDTSVVHATGLLRKTHGTLIAAVVHLAGYFDFTGEDNPLYEQVNIEGTRRLMRELHSLDVERFIYASTMLVHRPAKVGQRIDESWPIEPAWAYPRSKAAAEQVILDERGRIPCTLLRLAGLYDERTCVPTLAHQIARIYERMIRSRVYPGNLLAGQSFVHRADVLDVFRRTIERRDQLPHEIALLIGEPEVVSTLELHNLIGELIHGAAAWRTLRVPAAAAKAAAWLQVRAEPLVPDSIDEGKPPFIRPFMVERAQDHYAIDIARARELLDWFPHHDIRHTLPDLTSSLKADPLGWYRSNRVQPPQWLETATSAGENPDELRQQHQDNDRRELAAHRWAHLCNVALATWLISAPFVLGYRSSALTTSDVVAGAALLIAASISLSWRGGRARWACAFIGTWLLFAPVVFWAPQAAAYLNDTLCGMLAIGFAVATRPTPGLSPTAAVLGPTIPHGWDASPSSWLQRLPIVALAVVGLHISRYLAAYQLGHIESVWEPFFLGSADPKNGTEEIITSSVSRAWPVSDAGIGAVTYALEILTGIIGSARRWRTMPWLVLLFGLMIVPLGIVSLTFIIIQPILLGTWCTLCLIAATAMLVQIPYSLDEIVATCQFLGRRKRAGKSVLRVLLVGDTDEGMDGARDDEAKLFSRPFGSIIRDSLSGGVGMPWNLVASIAVGVWLLFTRMTVGSEGAMANADHLIGSLVITVAVTALAEVARPVRFINVGFGVALLVTPAAFDATAPAWISSIVCGIALIVLSLRRGLIRQRYGSWNRYLV